MFSDRLTRSLEYRCVAKAPREPSLGKPLFHLLPSLLSKDLLLLQEVAVCLFFELALCLCLELALGLFFAKLLSGAGAPLAPLPLAQALPRQLRTASQ